MLSVKHRKKLFVILKFLQNIMPKYKLNTNKKPTEASGFKLWRISHHFEHKVKLPQHLISLQN